MSGTGILIVLWLTLVDQSEPDTEPYNKVLLMGVTKLSLWETIPEVRRCRWNTSG